MSVPNFIGIDLFSGAGGMSEGADSVGVKIKVAVELDKYAAITYKTNHPYTEVFNDDIRKFKLGNKVAANKSDVKILFGGPPCQGFSTSNQKTRNKENEDNWLFKEYLRIAKEARADWVIVENVKGIIETEDGYFFDQINKQLHKIGYTTSSAVLNAADYGVPQIRNRVFIVGSLHGAKYTFPTPTTKKHVTVREAISDLPFLNNGANLHELDYRDTIKNYYQKSIRKNSKKSINNLVTRNAKFVLDRYSHIPQGGNWVDRELLQLKSLMEKNL